VSLDEPCEHAVSAARSKSLFIPDSIDRCSQNL